MKVIEHEYKVVDHHDLKEFQREVERALAGGWALAGGVAVTTQVHHGGCHVATYAQAVTRSKVVASIKQVEVI